LGCCMKSKKAAMHPSCNRSRRNCLRPRLIRARV